MASDVLIRRVPLNSSETYIARLSLSLSLSQHPLSLFSLSLGCRGHSLTGD